MLFRNLSAVDAYSGTAQSLSEYKKKVDELMEKGVKNPPEDIKNDPDKVARWKATEVWNAFTSHSLNRGQAIGILASQPFALAAPLAMQLPGPTRAAIIALSGTLECFVSSIYILMDNSNWHNFSNNLRKSMAESGKAEMTPEEFLKLRKSVLTKVVDSKAGQAGLSTAINVGHHIPESATGAVKKGYDAVSGTVEQVLSKHLSSALMHVLDKKYAKLSDEERKELAEHSH